MTLGKLIQHALNLCDGIVEAQEALGNLGVRESSFHEPLDWLRWGIDPGEDSSVKDMCDTCDGTEATKDLHHRQWAITQRYHASHDRLSLIAVVDSLTWRDASAKPSDI